VLPGLCQCCKAYVHAAKQQCLLFDAAGPQPQTASSSAWCQWALQGATAGSLIAARGALCACVSKRDGQTLLFCMHFATLRCQRAAVVRCKCWFDCRLSWRLSQVVLICLACSRVQAVDAVMQVVLTAVKLALRLSWKCSTSHNVEAVTNG
jgi:hypothetical protein